MNPLVRANYLASPPLVVAYALAGRVDLDLVNEPLGKDQQGRDVFLNEIWPSPEEVQNAVKKSVRREMFAKEYGEVFGGDAQWNSIKVPSGDLYSWSDKSTYIKKRALFRPHGRSRRAASRSGRHARAGRAGRFGHHRSYFTRRQYRGR